MLHLNASVKVLTYPLLFAFLLYLSKSKQPKKKKSILHLSSLTVSDKFFKANKGQNIVFNYYIGSTTVLRGWVLKKESGGRFNSTPDLILDSVKKPTLKIESKTFLSNQVLLSSQVTALVDAIGDREAILYFNPAKDAETGEIFYNITFDYKGSSDLESFALTSTSATSTFRTNPSPPHQAYE